jgi:hypothetical protein
LPLALILVARVLIKSNSGNRCYVSVIINNIKPYHNATAGGPNGVDDYSKWYYTLSTKYSAIKEGQNKLTGKLSCLLEGNSKTNSINVSNITNNLIKWYSVNVTGVSTSTTSTVNRNYQAITNSTTQPQPQQQQSKTEGNTTISSNSSAITNASHSNSKSNSSSPSIPKENNSNKIATSSGSVPTKLAQSPSTTRSASNYKYNNNNAKPLSISIQSSQNIVNGRGASTISATAYDVITGKRIDNAIVKLGPRYRHLHPVMYPHLRQQHPHPHPHPHRQCRHLTVIIRSVLIITTLHRLY